jgi:hypothetical protein
MLNINSHPVIDPSSVFQLGLLSVFYSSFNISQISDCQKNSFIRAMLEVRGWKTTLRAPG